MKEIKDVNDLEVGQYYYLFNKHNDRFVGLEEYKQESAYEPINEYKYFKSRMWTYEGDNQGMDRWHIFGPIKPELESTRLACEIADTKNNALAETTNPYKDQVICRGCFTLGTACGACAKCKDWIKDHSNET